MATPYYLQAPEGEEAKPSFWQRLSAGIDRTPSNSFYSLAQALSQPGSFGRNLTQGVMGFGQQFAEDRKQKSLASAFDSMAQTLPENMRPIFEAARNDPEMQRGLVSTMVGNAFAKPSEAWKPVDIDGDGQNDFQQSSITGEFKDMPKTMSQEERLRRAGASTTNVNMGGSEKDIFGFMKDQREKVTSAVSGLSALNQARGLVEKGGMFGAGADFRVGAAKVMSLLTGTPVDPKVVNTESFRAAIAPVVGATLKATSGTSQLSEGELRFAERAAAGDINLDQKTILSVLNILEKAMRNTVTDYNRQLNFAYPDGNPDAARTRGMFEIQLPPTAMPIAPPAAGAAPSVKKRVFNPATGRVE